MTHAILVFGDSIAWGRGEIPAVGWTGRLKDEFESENQYNLLFNLGIPGDTSSSLLKRFKAEASARIIRRYQDDSFRIVIAIGTNDARLIGDQRVAQTDRDVFSENITKLLAAAKSFTQDVIVVGLLPVDETRTVPWEEKCYTNSQQRLYNEILEKCARNADAEFVPLFAQFVTLPASQSLSDGVHPSSLGYDFIAQVLRDVILKEF